MSVMPEVNHTNLSFRCKPESSDRAASSAAGMSGALATWGAGGGKASRLKETTAALASPHSSSHIQKRASILAKKSENKPMRHLGDESSCGDARSVDGEDCDWTATQLAEGGVGGFYVSLSLESQPVSGPSGPRNATATITPQKASPRPSFLPSLF